MSNIVPVNIAVKADSPWETLKDFVDAAKKNPGKLRSGSASAAITMVWEGLLRQEGIDVTHLMYKGAADSVVAIMGGHIDIFVDALTPIVSQVDARQIRLLAAMSSKRNKNYQDIPTLKEIGYSKFSKDFWNGFFAPTGLSDPIMKKIVHTFEKALSQTDVRTRLEQAGVIPNFMGPKDFSKTIDEQYEFYMEVSKQKK
jgi:tripartite-type tricarboxylate transporter receptor subunit TctC